MTPRLLSTAAARKYLAGNDPSLLDVQPVFVRGEPYFDRRLIDRRLDELGGIAPTLPVDEADAELAAWSARHGAAARRS